MKKTQTLFVVLLLMGSVVLAGGTENPLLPTNMAIMKTTTGVRVYYKAEKVGKVKISIYDDESKEIFSEEVKSRTDFMRPYNLSNLDKGTYRVVIEDENGKREEVIDTHKEVKVLSSVIHAKKLQKCLVTLFSQDEADVKITLTDSNKNVLASDNFSIDGQAVRLFSLEKVSGPILVEVSDQNGVIRSSVIQ